MKFTPPEKLINERKHRLSNPSFLDALVKNSRALVHRIYLIFASTSGKKPDGFSIDKKSLFIYTLLFFSGVISIFDNPAFAQTRMIHVNPTGTLTIEEGDSTGGTLSITVSGFPVNAVRVSLSSTNPDVIVSPTFVQFESQDHNVARTVTVTARDDNDTVDDTDTITFSAAGGATATKSVSITDDDNWSSGTINLSPVGTLVIDEGDGSGGTFQVSLSAAPDPNVTVTLAKTNANVTLSPTSLIFTPSNYSKPQTVTVTAADDSDTRYDLDTITLSVSDGIAAPNVTKRVRIRDDESSAGIDFTPTSLTLAEGGQATFQVRLKTQPSTLAGVAFGIRKLNQASNTLTLSTSITVFEHTGQTNLWSEYQTFTVSAGQDGDMNDESFEISLCGSNAPEYGSVCETLPVTVTDDDKPQGNIEVTPAGTLTIAEGGSGTLMVKLSAMPSADVKVTLSKTNDDVTLSGATLSSYALTFTRANYSTEQTVTVNAAEDNADYADDTDTITFTATGGITASTVTKDVTITDNDIGFDLSATSLTVVEGRSGSFTVKLKSQPSANVTVALVQPSNTDVTINKTSLDFTTTNWGDIQTVTVNAAEDDDAVADSATINLTASGGNYGSVKGSVDVTVTENDTAGFELSEADGELDVDEESTASFTVKLDTQPSANVMVTLVQPSATANDDVTLDKTSLDFTTADWNVPQTVTVRAANDDDADDDSATINLTAAGGDYGSVMGSLTVEVDDDDEIKLVLSETTLAVTEGADATFKVKLDSIPSASVTVTLTQPRNTDVTVDDTSLTFTTTNWKDTQTVTVSADEDDADFEDETATISLSAANGGYDGVTGTVTVNVTDNDIGFDLSVASLTVAEGRSGSFTVKLKSQPSANVTVALVQPSNTDVTINKTSLDFTTTNWGDIQTVTVNAAEDADAVADSATINLTASGGDYGSVKGSVDVTVTENDTAGFEFSERDGELDVTEGESETFTVKLTSEPSDDVTVTLMQPSNTEVTLDTDTGTASNQNELTFTASNWNTAQTVTVSAANDDDAADDSATINLTAAGGDYGSVMGRLTVEVDDDDEIKLVFSQSKVIVEEGSSVTFTVRLDSRPSDDVTVRMTQPTNTEVTFRGGGELVFTTTNWYIPLSVVVDAAEDTDSVNDTATLNFTAEDGGYDGVTGSVTINVTDNDIGLDLSATSLTVAEGRSGSFTVKLKAEPTANVTVTLVQPSNTDVTINKTSLEFTTTNWGDIQTVTVNVAEDADAVAYSATIKLNALGGDYDDVEGSVTVNVTENDRASLMISKTRLDVDEERTASFTVRLTSEPTANVTVALAQPTASANIEVTLDKASLDFTTTDWNVAQTVTVRAANDDDADDDSATINLTAAGGDYAGKAASLTVMVDDNDMLGLVLTPASLTVNEGGSNTFTVRLEALPSGDVMVALAQSGTANADVSITPASLDFTTTNWNAAQTVTVSAEQDTDSDADMATIALSASGGGYAGITGSLVVTVADDEDIALTLSATALTLDEGGTATFTVKLASNSGGARTVKMASDNAEVTLSPAELMFTAANWSQYQTVTVTARQETEVDRDDDTANISFTGVGITAGSKLTVTVTDDDKGAPPEEEEESVTLQLATIAANLMPAISGTIGQRFDAPRGVRTATVAGRQVALDRSLLQDLAAGFAGRAGAQGGGQDRYAEDRFGAERHSGDWLGGVRLEDGRPLRTGAGGSSSSSSGRNALLSSFSYALGADATDSAGWSVWGRADTGEFSGTSDGLEFDGSQSSTWFGFDRRTDSGILSGVAYSSSSSDSDYTLGRFGASIETDMTIVMPYMELEGVDGSSGHIMLGLVDGDATLNQTNRLEGSADLS
nr:hypothetical protein [Gammaproteobacteria bacterium AqS3]